ncbi:nitronate monooxygenase [Novosphingobium fluoreni]|uniref:Nitronate monooxygenase n=1 Tax=Novosphingobium fluoreni TaxID=1391222 RepID=A0A7W6C2M9_9SPHN|nr:nitronate monooxygenase [Novosphingobium fluoreni]MBB3940494.1 nitronate monooxygenase [Novosphingobium fluoreni]
MPVPSDLHEQFYVPVIAAPMYHVSSARLAAAACVAGIGGSLARHNHSSNDAFENQLSLVQEAVLFSTDQGGRAAGPLAVNVATQLPEEDIRINLGLAAKYGARIAITSIGDPSRISPIIRDLGMLHFHDVTSMRFAEKAASIGVDGMVAIGAGGGGHAGTISHLVFIPQIREIFDGIIVMAGAVSHGAVVRAAQIMGADLAYMGTRFIATQEAEVNESYKAMLVDGTEADVIYNAGVNGMPASWLKASLRSTGLDPDAMPVLKERGTAHLPAGIMPWRDIWSGGQGIGLIHDIPSVAELVERLAQEYDAACTIPSSRQPVKNV